MLPKLNEIREYLATVKKVPADNLRSFDEHLATIAASSEMPTLVGMRDFKGAEN
jgi:hypothetical protein